MNQKKMRLPVKKDTELKSIKIRKDVHKKLKIRVANDGGNLTEFASDAILEKLNK